MGASDARSAAGGRTSDMMPIVAIPRGSNAVRLRITLEYIEPAPFRVVDVPLTFSLAKLNAVIQELFGWEDSHLWSFEVSGKRVELPDPEALWYPGGKQVLDARRFTVSRAVREAGGAMLYTYDFGDNWLHRIEFSQVLRVERPLTLPVFVEGKWAGPPEDCGGPFGFMDFKEAMADPSHEEHEHLSEWYGRPFDPEDLDEPRIQRALAHLRQVSRKRPRKTKARR